MASDPFFNRQPHRGALREPSFKITARQLGIILLFGSLSVLFAASIVAYVFTRVASDVWRTADMPGLPLGLLGSTALLVGVSAAAQYALDCARHNRFEALNRALGLTLVCAAAFLMGQAFNWHQMAPAALAPGTKTLYAFTFYLLTGLHAAHVVGGFVPLGLVMARARRKEYTSSRYEGVKFCVQYWHFLGVVWLILLVTLYLGS